MGKFIKTEKKKECDICEQSGDRLIKELVTENGGPESQMGIMQKDIYKSTSTGLYSFFFIIFFLNCNNPRSANGRLLTCSFI